MTEEKIKSLIKMAKHGNAEEKDEARVQLYFWNEDNFEGAYKKAVSSGVKKLLDSYDKEDLKSDMYEYLLAKGIYKYDETLDNSNLFCLYTQWLKDISRDFWKAKYNIKATAKDWARKKKIEKISKEYNIPIAEENAFLFNEIINTLDSHIEDKDKNSSIGTCITSIRLQPISLNYESYEEREEKGAM